MATNLLRLNSSDRGSILQLCSQLHDKCGTAIQIKINLYLQKETEARAAFLVLLLKESEEAVIQVIGEKVLKPEMRYPVPENILQSTVKRRRSFGGSTLDMGGDLLEKLCLATEVQPEIYYCVPVLHPADDHTVLIVYLVDYNTQKISESDCSQFVTDIFRYCLGVVLNTFAYEEEKRMKLQCENLLIVARNIFSHMDNLSNLLRQIMTEARKLTNAERCSLFLLDVERDQLVAEIFDGPESKEAPKEMRIAKNQGIAGQVATTGKLLNIRDAYSHPLFYKGIDEMTGFKTRNLLCFPIYKDNAVIGVAQLCNKINGLYFDVFDEEVAMGFSVYCGISLMHSLVYKKVQETQARSRLANELMMYHMKVGTNDVINLLNCIISHDIEKVSRFDFSLRMMLPKDELACYCLYMFKDLELHTSFKITVDTLAR
ncbi:cGMP-dependent 3' [Blattella germanica]|nr:cGMP-dependent 3' [Blattella germanica]